MHIKRSGIKRPAALLLCACVAAALLLSAWFVVSHAEHDCIGEHCAVCLQIQAAGFLLKQMGNAGIGAPAMLFSLLAVFALARGIALGAGNVTPVTLKVRMNN